MLKQRLLTAIVLLPLLISALFYLDSGWIAVLFGCMVVAGAWEWSALAGLRSGTVRIAYVMCLAVMGIALVLWVSGHFGNAIGLAAVSAVFWIAALIELVRNGERQFGWLGTRVGKLISGFFALVPAWVCAYFLHAVDTRAPMLLLWMLVMVWVADSAAYLAGSTVGRHKLAPTVSPGKTIEGAIGGVVAVGVVAGLGGSVFPGYAGKTLFLWIVLGAFVAMTSILGDLVESKYKRLAGVKDSGHLLPGHGGMLDRIDAVTSAAPAFVLGWYVLFHVTR